MWMTFDLDGVVMENPFNFGVFPHVLQLLVKHHLATEAGQGKEKESLREEVWTRLKNEHRRRFHSEVPYTAYDWDGIVDQLAREYGYPLQIDVAELVRTYCRPPYILSHDRADWLLQELKDQGWKIGVISNGYRKYQEPVLEALGLLGLIDILVTPEEAKEIKPNPGIFQVIPEVRAGLWVHVGDTLVHDIYGGKMAGAETVWVNRELPGDLKELSPAQRPKSEMGKKLVQTHWEKESQRYPGLCGNWEDCCPDGIIYNLEELLDWRKGMLG